MRKDKNLKIWKTKTFYIMVAVVIFGYFGLMKTPEPISQSQFFTELEKGNFSQVTIVNDILPVGVNVKYTNKETKETNSVVIRYSEENMDKIEKYADKSKTEMTIKTDSANSSSIISILSLAISGVFFFFMYRSIKGNMAVTTQKDEIKKSTKTTINFSNVAGKVEEKAELADVINYFKNTEEYKSRGLTIPRGILLEGPPGTGKTLLAKALAGEINATYYSLTGSEFNGMFRGMGTTKVKQLFKDARENSPSVIFIDEIDALARKRGGNSSITGDRDSDQTLNQLLTEMDGFEELDANVVVLAATNLSDTLDPAILRSGRFDRKVYVGLPNKTEREQILEYYIKEKKINPDVNLKSLSEQIQGFSGADIEGLVNEANLISYNNQHEDITQSDFEKAFNKVIVGVEKKSTVYTPEQKVIVANHESGHALVGALLESAKRVKKVTIIPHGRAGGFAMMLPKDEMFVQTKDYLENTIVTLLAGRGAEEILSNTQTTGVYQDIKEASEIARGMIVNYGMMGSLQFSDGDTVDKQKLSIEVDKVLSSCYEKTKEIINNNIPRIKLLSKVLQEKETLYEEEIDYIVSIPNDEIAEDFEASLEKALTKSYNEPV